MGFKEPNQRTLASRCRLAKKRNVIALVKGNSPAIAVSATGSAMCCQCFERKRQPSRLHTGHREQFAHGVVAFLPLSGGLLNFDALAVLDGDVDRDTTSHALGDSTELFELGEDAIELIDFASVLA